MERPSRTIGSSDARDVMLGNWNYLYRVKMGEIPPEDLSNNFVVQFGKFNEPFHLEWAIERVMDWKGSWLSQQQQMFTHYDFDQNPIPMHSTIDAELAGELPKGRIIKQYLEAKHTGRFKNLREAAEYYMPQLHHHMLCWDVKQIWLSVIFGNTEPEVAQVDFDEGYAQAYLRKCENFWRHIRNEEPPAKPDTAIEEAEHQRIAIKVPVNGRIRVNASESNSAAMLLDELCETQAAADQNKQVREDIKAFFKSHQGNQVSEIFGHERVTAKADSRGSVRFTWHQDPVNTHE